ncbi:hypothetical protein BV25DRAFT_1831027 [Artomyces pyxidatus]|uniref:Uncharacterized protein n=1 Tax=Artomyces pyxidatus TaxID=48021 RepID=A0ACB8SMH6_9AGAM|nr:hypothetical protein BV25DRAFT_1831027 [Artomyces pyxidatus]
MKAKSRALTLASVLLDIARATCDTTKTEIALPFGGILTLVVVSTYKVVYDILINWFTHFCIPVHYGCLQATVQGARVDYTCATFIGANVAAPDRMVPIAADSMTFNVWILEGRRALVYGICTMLAGLAAKWAHFLNARRYGRLGHGRSFLRARSPCLWRPGASEERALRAGRDL